MATGAIKTPSILQQSGIGPPAVLQGAGVNVRVDLPVGQNLVDQITTTTTFSFSGQRGGGQVITFPRFQVSLEGRWTDFEQRLIRVCLFRISSLAVMLIDFVTSSITTSPATRPQPLPLEHLAMLPVSRRFLRFNATGFSTEAPACLNPSTTRTIRPWVTIRGSCCPSREEAFRSRTTMHTEDESISILDTLAPNSTLWLRPPRLDTLERSRVLSP